jgi:HTH-type transcriptional regulator/antitoxin HigA
MPALKKARRRRRRLPIKRAGGPVPVRTRHRTINRQKYAQLVAESLPVPPRTEAENGRIIKLLSALTEREEDLRPEEAAFAELLAIIVEDFEDKHYALPAVEPRAALKALMQDRGLLHKDIAAIVGNKGLTTEILAGRRKISPTVAKRLADQLHVPLELFM